MRLVIAALTAALLVVPGVSWAHAGSIQTTAPKVEPPTGTERVELVLPDGSRQVRYVPLSSQVVPGDSLPVQPEAEPSNPPKELTNANVVPRPFHTGLSVTRKGETGSGSNVRRPSIAKAVPGATSVRSSKPGTLTVSGGGGSAAKPPAPPDGGGGVVSSYRPVNPNGAGLGAPPLPPQSLFTVDKGTGGGVTVAWVDPSTDLRSGIVQRQSQDPQTKLWGATVEFVVGPTARAFEDRPGAGSHRYRVAAVNRAGASDFSAWGLIEIAAMLPSPPLNLSVTGLPPRLTWLDGSDNETRFEMQREKQSGASWTATTTITLSPDTTSYVDTPGAGVFRYRVRAANDLGPSPWTDWEPITSAETPPEAPSDLVLLDFGTGFEPRLGWTDNSTNETSFELQREKQVGAQWGGLVTYTTGTDVASFQDNPGVATFRYRVRAVNGSGASAFTPYVVVTVAAGLPSMPANLSAIDAGDGGSVKLAWMDTSVNETGFEIQREAQSGQTWIGAATLVALANTTEYFDGTGVGTFRYRMRAVGSAGASPYSAWVNVTVSNSPPTTPQAVTASDMGTRRALVSWNYDKTDVSGFDLERSPAFASGTVNVGSTVRGYVDPSGPGAFSYRVRSVGPAGISAYSVWAPVTVSEILPDAPSDLVVSDTGSQQQARLIWRDNATNEAGFKIQRQTQQTDGQWGAVADLPAVAADTVQFLDSPGPGQHRYRVSATNSLGDSAWTPWTMASLTSGWTALVPSSDTRFVYVSNSTGNDANSGLTEGAPVKSLARGFGLLRTGSADWLLLKSGDVWTEGFPVWRVTGRSPTEPMVISSYGQGERPRLNTPPNVTAFNRQPGGGGPATIDNIWIVGIAFVCTGYVGDQQNAGISWLGPGSNILIEDCLIQGYKDNIVIQSDPANVIRNLTLKRNVIVDAFSLDSNGHSQGLFVAWVDGLNIIGNVFDHNGWKDGVAPPNIFNHNLYITADNLNVVLRDNIISRASGHGLQLRPGGTVENNLFVRNPMAMFTAKTVSVIRNNVVLEGTDIPPDIPRGFGIDVIQVPMNPPTIVDGNIIANKLSPNAFSQALGVGFSPNDPALPPPGRVIFTNNIVYNWKAFGFSPASTVNTQYGKVEITGNMFLEPTSSGGAIAHNPVSVDVSRFTYSGNAYNTVASKAFQVGGVPQTLASWKAASGEANASNTAQVFPGANNTTSSYNASLGGAASFDAFIAECRKQSKQNWREAYSGPEVCKYIRAGFNR